MAINCYRKNVWTPDIIRLNLPNDFAAMNLTRDYYFLIDFRWTLGVRTNYRLLLHWFLVSACVRNLKLQVQGSSKFNMYKLKFADASTHWTRCRLHPATHAIASHDACTNISTTPIMAMGCQQCLPLSVVQLKGKHCRKPHCCNGVVDTFGQ